MKFAEACGFASNTFNLIFAGSFFCAWEIVRVLISRFSGFFCLLKQEYSIEQIDNFLFNSRWLFNYNKSTAPVFLRLSAELKRGEITIHAN